MAQGFGRGVTLSDIAERTGVSKVTVSYVLNERPSRVRISERTRERVREAAREMGYHPNAVARALARKRTDTIALVMQSPTIFRASSGFIAEMMHGVMEAANDLGYDLLLHTKPSPNTVSEALALSDGRTDGSLLLRDYDDTLASALSARNHPCVSVFSCPQDEQCWYVDADNVLGGRLAAQRLIDLGHRRIGYLGGSPRSSASVQRLEGYRQALAEARIAPNPLWELERTGAGGDWEPVAELMRRPEGERPSALFAWSDDVAQRTIPLLRDGCNLRVPEDVSLVGFDGTAAIGERGTTPALTSVRQPIDAIARQGVALLAARIRGESVEKTQIRLLPQVVERASVGPPRNAGPG